MNDRSKKKDGRPRSARNELTAQQRAFAEHYAMYGDWVEALHHAYPASLAWKSQSKHGTIARMRANPLIRDAIDEIRRPALEEQQVTFGRILGWAVKCFEAIMDDPTQSSEQRKWILLHCKLIGMQPVGNDGRVPLPAPPASISNGDVIDADFR